MLNPGKEFPGANHTLILLLIKILPYLLGAGLLIKVGFFFAEKFKRINTGYVFSVFLFVLIVLLLLKFDRGWNFALLTGFAIVSGFLFRCLDPEFFQRDSVLLFFSFSLLAWIGAGFLKWDVSISSVRMLTLSIIYFLGWFWIGITKQQITIFTAWVLLGIVLNVVALFGVLKRAKEKNSGIEEIPLAVDIIVLNINLFWFSAYLVL